MPAASITATSAQAFVVPARAFGYEIKNVSDTTVYLRHAKTAATSGASMGMPLEPGERRTFAFRHKLNHELTVMGIHGGSGSKSVVWDTLDQEVVAAGGGNSTANVTLSAGDVELGALELKNSDTDARANVLPANTARTTATNVLAVQHVDAAGNVLPASPVLGAGAAIVGRFGIDQTTPGTTNAVFVKNGMSFSIPAFDFQAFTYVGATNNVSTIVFKSGGAGGTTVASLTFTYVGAGAADDDDVATITQS